MFEVYLLKGAEGELESLPKKTRDKINEHIKTLSQFPDVRRCKKISGYEDTEFSLRSIPMKK
ncbi:MAG TPA: hypothetical protein ENH13_06780 [Euryarchaeota archaeon]|nr:hypothetical protein [Euryarchaeota archaeon]